MDGRGVRGGRRPGLLLALAGISTSRSSLTCQDLSPRVAPGSSASTPSSSSATSSGGLFGGVVGFLFYARRHPVDVWRSADAIAFGLPVGWLFGRIACASIHDHPGVRSVSPFAVAWPGGSRFDLGLLEFMFVPLLIVGVLLVARHAPPEQIADTRKGLDTALSEAEAAIGSGPSSSTTVVTNTAIIVFREGLEGVLILAVLTASMVGVQRRLRRPLFVGALAALAASGVTWVIAQTILSSLNRYGEKLSAVVGVVAIAVLLLILNWFFHKVYWTGHLSGLHQKKQRAARNARTGFLASQAVGLAILGFTSVYREGFETVLFLQAIALESSVAVMAIGVLIGLGATAAVGFITFKLQTRLPYKRMLVITGVLVAWVLVVMTGSTVQVFQKVGWLPVTPVEGLSLPYWSGLWLGIYPTWQGIGLQIAAFAFVVGSYVVVEAMRRSKRNRVRIGGGEPLAARDDAPGAVDAGSDRSPVSA